MPRTAPEPVQFLDEDGTDHCRCRPDSPAATAGIVAGDLIEQVDGKKLGEGPSPAETWDAETLSDYLRRAAIAGREVELTRDRAPLRTARTSEAKIRVKPQVPTMMNMPGRAPGTPMAANEIGIAYRILNEVALVTPNSPAAAANIAAGDKVRPSESHVPRRSKMCRRQNRSSCNSFRKSQAGLAVCGRRSSAERRRSQNDSIGRGCSTSCNSLDQARKSNLPFSTATRSRET